MKNKALIKLFFLAAAAFWPAVVQAETFIKTDNTAQIEKIFQKQNYKTYLLPSGENFPQIFIQNIPEKFGADLPEKQKQDLFFRILAPLALKVNAELEKERKVVIYLQHKFAEDSLDAADEAIIEKLALKYDVSTPMQGHRRYAILLKQLKLRINAVPPSLFLAIAAINTNWGQAKFLPLSNNLYRELNWYSDEGLKPEDEKEDDSYRIRIYPSLYTAMADYALKLNSNVDYQEFREMRQMLLDKNQQPNGKFLAPYLIFASDLPNFAGLLDYTITFSQLDQLDRNAALAP